MLALPVARQFIRVLACALLLASLAASGVPSRALACGISGPDGVWSCSLEEHEEETRPRWTLGAAAAYTHTRLRFSDDLRAGQTRNAVVAAAAYALTRRFSLRASAGVAFAGELRAPNGTHTFSAGPTAAVGVDYRLLSGKPFLLLSALLSATSARTRLGSEHARYSAFDLRLGAAFGVTLFDALSPYALARVFGGPVFWRYAGEARTGTDAYHYQLGVGLAWLVTEHIDVSLEGVPLGERALSGGVAVVF